MNLGTVLMLAIAPGLFWLWFFYRKDRLKPEPQWLVAKTFFWGILLAIPVLIVQLLAIGIFPLNEFLQTVLLAPITEEYGKYLVVRNGVYNDKEFDEPVDGIIYAATAALGFASIENVMYILGTYYNWLLTGESSLEELLILVVFRGLLSVPGHALFASFWGYALGIAKFSPPERAGKLIRNGLLLSMLGHGLFNALLVTSPSLAIGVLILIPILWQMVSHRINQALNHKNKE